MEKKRLFVTGMAGYVGGCLCRELGRAEWCGGLAGTDVKVPAVACPEATFRRMDITDPALVGWVRETRPDMVVHLAFIVEPIHDEERMRRTNVEGTRNVLRAVREARVPQLLVMSSATAYGAWPDNPVPLRESDPIRPHPGFSYARHKAEVEADCARFMEEHPEVITSLLRPCVIYGPGVDNYISGLFTLPVAMQPTDHASPFQFVHEDDVVRAVVTVLEKQGRGPYNLAPPDTVTVTEVNAMTGKPSVPMPDWALKAVFRIAWGLRLPFLRVPPAFLDFVRYPWVVDSTRLTEGLGFTYTHSTRETLEIMLRAKGVLS